MEQVHSHDLHDRRRLIVNRNPYAVIGMSGETNRIIEQRLRVQVMNTAEALVRRQSNTQ